MKPLHLLRVTNVVMRIEVMTPVTGVHAQVNLEDGDSRVTPSKALSCAQVERKSAGFRGFPSKGRALCRAPRPQTSVHLCESKRMPPGVISTQGQGRQLTVARAVTSHGFPWLVDRRPRSFKSL